MSKDDKALSRAELEFTQRFQMHFPHDIPPSYLHAWNSCPKHVLSAFIGKVFSQMPPILRLNYSEVENPYVKRVNEEPLVIGPTTGNKVLGDYDDLFVMTGRQDVKRPEFLRARRPTEEVKVDIYTSRIKASLDEMIGAFVGVVPGRQGQINDNDRLALSGLCLTQEQILFFLTEHRDRLRPKPANPTYFLLEVEGNICLIIFRKISQTRLQLDSMGFGGDTPWKPNEVQIVIPH